MSERTKVCHLCGQRRSLDEFNRHPTTPDGRDHRCKKCVRGVALAHRQGKHFYGPPIIPPLGPPRCWCGQSQKFGSDPMTGASTAWCPVHGESALPIYRGAAA